ncbi:MAG: hypothetical protein AAGA75_15925 [Cyanobacteria bacterium P01_E01_bin.6]
MNWFHEIANHARKQKHHFVQEYSNHFRYYKRAIAPTKEVINQKELRIVGLRRTGNHAVIVWIRAQHPDHAWHINHPPAGKNPYQFLYTHYKKPELRQEAMGKFSHKSLLMMSYEDQNLEEICSETFEKFHDTYVGVSANRFDVLILRDPFNLLASQIKSNMSRLTDSSATETIQRWKTYAREFLGETNFLTHNKLCVSFNTWHTDSDYRKHVAESLDFTFTDAGRERVKDYGGGSSFDGQEHDGKASQLKILDRWQLFEHVDAFWHLFRDDELLHYAERIFGKATLPFDRVKLLI